MGKGNLFSKGENFGARKPKGKVGNGKAYVTIY